MAYRQQSSYPRRMLRNPYQRTNQRNQQMEEPVVSVPQPVPVPPPPPVIAEQLPVNNEPTETYQLEDQDMPVTESNTEPMNDDNDDNNDYNNEDNNDDINEDNNDNNDNNYNDDNTSMYDENGKVHFRKIFRARKKPSVRAKEKRLRQNRLLRRSLLPKSALMALHELKNLVISEFTFTQNIPGGFTAHVTVNGKQYDGKGSSKMMAKNAACECALRDFVIAKMIERPRLKKLQKITSESEKGDGSTSQSTLENEDMCNTDSQQSSSTNLDDADELPMLNVASFALYKLFSDWEREGYVVPELHPNGEIPIIDNNTNGATPAVVTPKEPKKTIRTELPANWETMHPATVLCMMRPGLSYTDFGSTGEKNEMVHSMGVTVDDVQYVESGRSKKIARRNVAVTVCNSLFGTNFVKEA